MSDLIQEQLALLRKNQILDASATVFSQKGYHASTIRDIAKQAGIADGTIYNYFESKPALLIALFQRMRDTLIQDETAPELDQIDLATFVRMMLVHPLQTMHEDDFALFRIVMSEMMVNQEFRTMYYEQIIVPTLTLAESPFQQLARQQGVDSEQAQLVLHLIASLVMGLMVSHILDDRVLVDHWDNLPDMISDLLLNGLKKVRS